MLSFPCLSYDEFVDITGYLDTIGVPYTGDRYTGIVVCTNGDNEDTTHLDILNLIESA